jgi:uroporphyrinogen-III synthase
LDALYAHGADARALAGIALAAVGDATAAALRGHGLRADLVPEEASGAGLARALVARDPRHVLLPRAEDGREELGAILAAAGVRVDAVTAYRTVPAPRPELEPVLERLAAGTLDVLTFFAPSQVTAVAAAAGAASLNRARVICAIGPTTAQALRDLGVRVDLVPAAASAAALAAELAEHLKEGR